ncbi:MAG: GtrA family protein [Ruminococcus sp.]|nr:GtrA family protein [Ruminococcus sp.]
MENKKDIFDKIMSLPVLRIFEGFYRKNKSILLYLFFGVLTTAVSILSFFVAGTVLGINVHIANTISWVLAVTFAFVTNRIWVFDAKCETKKEFFIQAGEFYSGRLATYFVEELILIVFVNLLTFNQDIVKIIAQIVILILNYLVSKFFVFRKKEK